MVAILELYNGVLRRPECSDVDRLYNSMLIRSNGHGFRRLDLRRDVDRSFLLHARRNGFRVRRKSLIFGDSTDPIDSGCGVILNALTPMNSSNQWCCTPSFLEFQGSSQVSGKQVCFGQGSNHLINIPYTGLALINSSGSLALLMDSTPAVSGSTPGWSNPSYGISYLCATSNYNGTVLLSFTATPSSSFTVSEAYLFVGTNPIASGGVYASVIQWEGLSASITAGLPVQANIYLGVS